MGFKVNRTGGMVVGAHNIGGGGSPSGTIEITENGTYDVSAFAEADVQTPVPTGKINITENGADIDVSSYALADVDVPVGLKVNEKYIKNGNVLEEGSVTADGYVTANIPKDIDTLGNSAFTDNEYIQVVNIPSNIIRINDGVSSGGPTAYGCFSECKNFLTINFENGIKYIGKYAFLKCYIRNIILPNSCETINSAFYYSNLQNITLNQGLKNIQGECFASSDIKEIDLPNSVIEIGDQCFNWCENLTDVKIRCNVNIGYNTFAYCTNLRRIFILTTNLGEIDATAFENCENVETIFFVGTQSEFENIVGYQYLTNLTNHIIYNYTE